MTTCIYMLVMEALSCCIAKVVKVDFSDGFKVKGKGNVGFQVLHDDDFMFGFQNNSFRLC